MKRRRPRNHGKFRRHGIADPAPLLVNADELARAAKLLAAARMSPAKKAERSAKIKQHIEALRADIARRVGVSSE